MSTGNSAQVDPVNDHIDKMIENIHFRQLHQSKIQNISLFQPQVRLFSRGLASIATTLLVQLILSGNGSFIFIS